MLGDNIFYGQGFSPKLYEAVSHQQGATVFGYEVTNPKSFGAVETIETRQEYKISCLEEIAFNNGWLGARQLEERGNAMDKNSYGQYLLALIEKSV